MRSIFNSKYFLQTKQIISFRKTEQFFLRFKYSWGYINININKNQNYQAAFDVPGPPF